MSLRHVTDALPITGRDEGISADALLLYKASNMRYQKLLRHELLLDD